MKKTLFDAGPCNDGDFCPKFVLDTVNNTVSLVDTKGNSAVMTIKEFNTFVDAVHKGELKKV